MINFFSYPSGDDEAKPRDHSAEASQGEDCEENELSEIPPALYSKRVIFSFCLLFSTIFGAVILMSNLKKKGEKTGIIQVLIFALIFTGGMLYTVNSLQTTQLTIPLNILGAVTLNEYFWNRYLGRDIEFEKKSWVKPAIISVTVSIPFVLAVLYA